MGVFLHSSEHWLVVMDSVMTEILWSSQISISTVSHRPHLDSLHHPGLLSTFFISTSSSPPHNGRLLSRLNLPKNSVVFLSLGQKGANENLLCFNYVFWPAVCPVVDGQHKNICYTSIPQSRPQHTWRQANVINIRRAATSWWTGEWALNIVLWWEVQALFITRRETTLTLEGVHTGGLSQYSPDICN